MRKPIVILALLVALVLGTTACTSNVTPEPSPTATVEVSPSVAPAETGTPAPSPTSVAQGAKVFKLVGQAAEIMVGTTQVRASAYYTGEGEDTMVLPLAEVCKALGWSVAENNAAGPSEVRISKDGAETVNLTYEKPDHDADSVLENVRVTREGKDVNTGSHPFAYINGILYGTEVFFDKALQEIDVKVDGSKTITIETKV